MIIVSLILTWLIVIESKSTNAIYISRWSIACDLVSNGQSAAYHSSLPRPIVSSRVIMGRSFDKSKEEMTETGRDGLIKNLRDPIDELSYQFLLDISPRMANRTAVDSRPSVILAHIVRASTHRGHICNNIRNSRDRCSTRRWCSSFPARWQSASTSC